MGASLIFAFFCIVFAAAFAVGWHYYRIFFWNCVDLLYYPLAAIGVVLFFISNDVQRELLEVTRLSEQERLTLAELKKKRPNTNLLNTERLLNSGIDTIALITKWMESCDIGPSTAEPRCLVVMKLGPYVNSFLKVARGEFSSYEERLLSTCAAADKMLESIRTSEAISTLVMEKFLSQYIQAASLKLSPLDYDSLDIQVNQFRVRAILYAEQIHGSAFQADDDLGRLLLDIYNSEIEYGELIFRGLFQCITASREELSLLNKWASEASTKEQELARLEIFRQQLKEMLTKHTNFLWLQLNLWPLVLVTALSLKFAKGAATFRKARNEE